MKKLFFGLLIVAARRESCSSFQTKKRTIEQSPDSKELILGKWKMNSIEAPAER